jgi:hypothetical protein
MKRYLILIGAVLVVLALAWTAFGQREGGRPAEGREARGRAGALSAEERASMRERFQNMSEEEREKFRAQMRERFGSGRRGLGREDQLKTIKAIEAQLAKLKAGIEASAAPRTRGQDLSDEERAKLRERFTKAREDRQKAIKAIIAQVARLQGQRQPAEGEEYILINTVQLKAVRELAVKEKATETAQRLERLGRGRMGFRSGRPAGTRPTTPGTTDRPRRPGRE